jgi:hypothetical protein
MCSEPESPRIVQDDDLISAVPNFLEPNGYYERMLLLWPGSVAGWTVTTELSVTGRRRQRLTATAPCSAAIPHTCRDAGAGRGIRRAPADCRVRVGPAPRVRHTARRAGDVPSRAGRAAEVSSGEAARPSPTPTSSPATSSSTEARKRSCDDSDGTSTATNLSLGPDCGRRRDGRSGMGWNWPTSRLRS